MPHNLLRTVTKNRYVAAMLACAFFMASLSIGAYAAERYRLELFITWSEDTHPFDWPGDKAHLSGLIGVAHNPGYSMFADGELATAGLKQLAETGKTSLMERELKTASLTGRSSKFFYVDGIDEAPGYLEVEFDATLDHSMVSFATMIAPSPDWFTGASAVSLRAKGEWRDSLDFLIWAWDAGTDSGPTYDWPDLASNPQQSVRLLATRHVIQRKLLRPIGRAVLTRLF